MRQIGLFQVLFASACLAVPVAAAPVLDFTSATQSTFATFTGGVGWSFSTNQSVTVVALDTWKLVSDPTTPVTVRLYDGSQNILASALVDTTDPLVGGAAQFYSHAIAPVVLAAGTTYYIAQDVSAVGVQAVGLSTDPAINFLGGLRSAATLTPLSDAFGGAFAPAYFGPNFEIAGVPEPSTLYTGLGAMAALAIVRRRRR